MYRAKVLASVVSACTVCTVSSPLHVQFSQLDSEVRTVVMYRTAVVYSLGAPLGTWQGDHLPGTFRDGWRRTLKMGRIVRGTCKEGSFAG